MPSKSRKSKSALSARPKPEVDTIYQNLLEKTDKRKIGELESEHKITAAFIELTSRHISTDLTAIVRAQSIFKSNLAANEWIATQLMEAMEIYTSLHRGGLKRHAMINAKGEFSIPMSEYLREFIPSPTRLRGTVARLTAESLLNAACEAPVELHSLTLYSVEKVITVKDKLLQEYPWNSKKVSSKRETRKISRLGSLDRSDD